MHGNGSVLRVGAQVAEQPQSWSELAVMVF